MNHRPKLAELLSQQLSLTRFRQREADVAVVREKRLKSLPLPAQSSTPAGTLVHDGREKEAAVPN